MAKRNRRAFDRARWRLHAARLGSFLEHARVIARLAADAREKYSADYIFDRQYILTTIDRTIEHVDGLLFDAEVLGAGDPSSADLLERCKTVARDLYEAKDDEAAADAETDPEYVLLRRYSRWVEGPAAGGEVTVMDVVRRSVDAVLADLSTEPSLGEGTGLPRIASPVTGVSIQIADLGGGLDESAGDILSPADILYRPLELLLMGAGQSLPEGDAKSAATDRWIAVVDRQHLSLRRTAPAAPVVVEATVSGRAGADWLFVYGAAGEALFATTAVDLHRVETDAGIVLWCFGEDAGPEDALAALGSRLLRFDALARPDGADRAPAGLNPT